MIYNVVVIFWQQGKSNEYSVRCNNSINISIYVEKYVGCFADSCKLATGECLICNRKNLKLLFCAGIALAVGVRIYIFHLMSHLSGAT